MQSKLTKILKKIGIGLLALILFIALSIGFVFQFVLTPEKITPKVVEALNKNLDADLSLEAVELTFFKTFPSFKLELREGIIIKKLDSMNASSALKTEDTLISFESAVVSVNPIAFLRDKIKVNHFTFTNPKIYALVNPNGDVNWDILKETTDSESDVDSLSTTEEKEPFKASIDLEDISIINGSLVFDDRYTENYFTTQGFNMDLSAQYNEKEVLIDLNLDSEDIVFRNKEGTYSDNLEVKLVTDFKVDRLQKQIEIEEAMVALNELTFQVFGKLMPNKLEKQIDVDLSLELAVPTLNTLIDLVPETIFDRTEKYEASGQALITAKITGVYKKGLMPSVEANLLVKEGSLSYDNRPNQIELIQINADLFIPPDKGVESNFNIHQMRFKGVGSDLTITGSGKDIFNSANLDLNFDGSLDLEALEKTFPFKKEIDLEGKAQMSIDAKFSLADLKKQDYGRIQAVGKLNLEQIIYDNKTDSLGIKLSAADIVTGQDQNSALLTSEKTKVFGGKILIKELDFNHGSDSKGYLHEFDAKFASTPLKDSSQVATMMANILIDKFSLNLGDSLKAKIKYLNGDFKLMPKQGEPKTPQIVSKFKVDSTGAIFKGKRIGLIQARYDLKTTKEGNNWPLDGSISFGTMYAFTPRFPLQIEIPKTLIVMKPGLIELDHAKLIVGQSDLTVTGRVYNIGDAFLEDKIFKGELEVASEKMNLNEIIQATNEGAVVTEQQIDQAMNQDLDYVPNSDTHEVSTEPRSFVVPDNLDLRLQSRLDKVIYKRFEIDDVVGLITVKDQKIDLAKLQMKTMAANVQSSVAYSAPQKGSASLDFDFMIYDIDLSKLTVLFPVIDSLLPMADSFEGKVNFRTRGASRVDGELGIIAPSLDAIARLEGDNLVILDGKTFQKISKMLLFKNKEKNTIDKLEFAMLFQDKTIEVFPSVITVDRYKVAVGGQHKLDMTFDYHISILKSPMPFKAGIDLKGTDDDMDYKITKAKYKYLFSTKERQQKKADSTILKQKIAIIKSLPMDGD